MKKVWIIAPFANIDTVGVRNRFQYLANRLNNEEIEVTLFTSDFDHLKKKTIGREVSKEYPYKVILIHEPGYEKNVSIKRVYSHLQFTFSFRKVIKKMEKPDVIYAAYPTMSASYFSGRYAKKSHIPFILDIQDTWPESISAAIDTENVIVKLVIGPFTKLADRVYRMADIIFGVSKTYVKRANVRRTNCKEFISVYIGTELDKFDSIICSEIKKEYEDIWITYIGTLSHSYDIETAIKAFGDLKEYKNIKLNILGTGPDEDRLIKIAKKLGVNNTNVFFYGHINYEKMVGILKKSDVALNALTVGSRGTITNKLCDYVSACLPILNSCQEKEVLELITNKKLGLNYIPGEANSLKSSIIKITGDRNEMYKSSKNSRLLAKDYFDRKESYTTIIEKIKDISI